MPLDLSSVGFTNSVADIVFSSDLRAITYPPASNQPIGPTFAKDSIVRASIIVSSLEPAGGDSGVIDLTVLQPNGQRHTVSTEAIYEGGLTVQQFLLAVKANEHVFISIRSGSTSETVLQAMAFALVLESVL